MKNKFLNIGLIATTTLATTFGLVSCDPKNKTTTSGKLSNNNNNDSKYEPLAPGAHISKLSLNDLMVYSSISEEGSSVGDWINKSEKEYVIWGNKKLFIDNYLLFQKSYRAKNIVVSDKEYENIFDKGLSIVSTMYYAKTIWSKTPKNKWSLDLKNLYNWASSYYSYFKGSSIKNKIPLVWDGTKIQWV